LGNVKRRLGVLTTAGILAAMPAFGTTAHAEETPDFPLNEIDAEEAEGEYYVPSSVDNIHWGDLPNRESQAVESIQSGETVTFDTVSHEGILEDQGRDPVEYFSQHGIEEDQVLEEAKEITASNIEHDFEDHGPHVVTGPVEVEGAQPGDVLKVEVMSLTPRVPYGVISNRHYKGALPDEFPENEGPEEGASAENPELYNNVSTFTPIEQRNGEWMAEIPGEDVYFPIDPFMGLMGVASDTDEYVNSVPPSETGGNIDINELGVGSTLYLPVEVAGAMFYTGDPHFAQGDGEVALTALEGSLRGTFRLTVLEDGEESIPGENDAFDQPFGETDDYWIPIGLDEDLDEAMKESTRESIDFLSEELGMDRAKAYAYLSAATDYEVSQVVDKTKGIHALIQKAHFDEKINQDEMPAEETAHTESEESGGELPDTSTNTILYILLGTLLAFGSGLWLFQKKRSV
jgi:LPXTG-motif cell wall-anchored protein